MTSYSWYKIIVSSPSRIHVLFRWQQMWEVTWISIRFDMRLRGLNAQLVEPFCIPSGFDWYHSCGHVWKSTCGTYYIYTERWLECEVWTKAQTWGLLGFDPVIKVKNRAQSANRNFSIVDYHTGHKVILQTVTAVHSACGSHHTLYLNGRYFDER